MSRRSRRAAGAVLSVLALAACGGDDDADNEAATAPPAATGATRDPGNEDAVRVDLDEFSLAPSEVGVERGAAIEAVNVGNTPHNLVVKRGEKGDEVIGTETFPGGERRTLEVDADPGRYTLVCTVPGHREAGMTGTIPVR